MMKISSRGKDKTFFQGLDILQKYFNVTPTMCELSGHSIASVPDLEQTDTQHMNEVLLGRNPTSFHMIKRKDKD